MNTICSNCGEVTEILGNNIEELLGDHRWQFGYPCPYCCEGVAHRCTGPELELLPQRSLTDQQYFQALYNLGLPEERAWSTERIRELLAEGVVGIDLGRDSDRTVIQMIEVSSGHVLHLGASVGGAVVYKVTRGRKDVREVHLGSAEVRQGGLPHPDSDRAQAGPPAEAVPEGGVPAVRPDQLQRGDMPGVQQAGEVRSGDEQ